MRLNFFRHRNYSLLRQVFKRATLKSATNSAAADNIITNGLKMALACVFLFMLHEMFDSDCRKILFEILRIKERNTYVYVCYTF